MSPQVGRDSGAKGLCTLRSGRLLDPLVTREMDEDVDLDVRGEALEQWGKKRVAVFDEVDERSGAHDLREANGITPHLGDGTSSQPPEHTVDARSGKRPTQHGRIHARNQTSG